MSIVCSVLKKQGKKNTGLWHAKCIADSRYDIFKYNKEVIKMSSISIFPCSLTNGEKIVEELHANLQLDVYTDRQLFEDTKKKFGVETEELEKLMYQKTSVFNKFTLEKEQAASMLRIVLANKISGPASNLYYGLHALLIPKEVTEVLRVLVVDTIQARVERGVSNGLDKKQAKREVKQHDISSFSWSDFLFKEEPYQRSLYDLVIPVNGRSHKEIAEEILKFYRKTSVLRTAESQQAVSNMKTSAEVERKLLSYGHKVPVQVDNNKAVITVENRIIDWNDVVGSITHFAKEVQGVDVVEINKVESPGSSIYRRQKFELPSKVLFVDDEREFVQAVSHRLIDRDVGTYGVYNGEEALEVIKEDRPDVMVLDLKMPGLYGTEVLRRTKEIAPHVEVIILTGHGTVKDEQECMELGAFAYLNKPVDIEKLSATIKAAYEKVVNH